MAWRRISAFRSSPLLCNLPAEEQVFIDLERRRQAEILQDRVDPLLSGLRRSLMRCPPAVDFENAAIGRDGAENDIDESRFPGAVLTQ